MQQLRPLPTNVSLGILRHLKSENSDAARRRTHAWRKLTLVIASPALWLVVATTEALNPFLPALLVIAAIALATLLFLREKTIAGLMIVAYLAALEPAIREYALILRYFVLEYAFLMWSVLLLSRRKERIKLTAPFLFFALYVMLDLVSLLGSFSMERGRTVLVPGVVLLFAVVLGSNLSLGKKDAFRVFNGYLLGAVSLAILIIQPYFGGQSIVWSTSSNFAASGNMGPVQVSFLLSLGAFLCIINAESAPGWQRAIYGAVALLLSSLMVLTFARGGLYLLLGAVIVYYVLLQPLRLRTLVILAAVLFSVWLIFYLAGDFTAGTVYDRYSELDTTNRWRLVVEGWKIFLDNPLFGVGTGNYYKVVSAPEYFGKISGAHNELIRAAAEHGIVGLTLWLFFAVTLSLQAINQCAGQQRNLRIVLLVLFFASLSYNGLKLMPQQLVVLFSVALFSPPLDRETANSTSSVHTRSQATNSV